ncbi:SH3 domain-containing protein [Marimonas arenosa]|uniref:SH3 domain-containing protein n=1 Tax=Marimonas arenosa TaxID=1795305 RepID=UPI0035E3E033
MNVRSGPSTAYNKLFQLRKGQAVKELETRDGWTKLSSNNHSGCPCHRRAQAWRSHHVYGL